ncbi:complement C1q-like protein 3 [Ostrea edulis]|uniref:complement C1q-like protein 3 n=1 Tax=Ostrea edulis TaxID=37623 RepID=UPI0024AEC3C8|nr:complement C1q-like protein 3 [Ostrea edulis]
MRVSGKNRNMMLTNTVGFICLVSYIAIVNCNCYNNQMVKKLFKQQMNAMENSINGIVDSYSNYVNVAFHVFMGTQKEYQKGVVWIYDQVVTNTKNGYDTTTGKFTAPERGVYLFTFNTLSNPGKMSHGGLHLNGTVKTWQACNNSGGNNVWKTCSDSATLLLEKGDTVYIADHLGSATVREKYTSFTGVQIS